MGKRAKGDGNLPPWTGDDAALQAWINVELDRWDYEFHRDLIEAANHWLRSLPPRSEAESRKRHLILGKRESAAHRELMKQRAIEEGDVETLRRLDPELAQFIHAPKNSKPGRRKNTVNHDPDSAERRLKDALEEARRIRIILKKYFDGRSNRPTGALTVERMAAERWGLTEADVRKRHVHVATRKRLARQR
jgi:hypothetical protein